MKICYITNNDFAGAAHSLLDLLSGLKNTEVQPVVLLNKHGPMDGELDKIGVSHYHIPFCFATKSKSCVKTLFKPIINSLSVHLIAWFLKHERMDIVHINCFMLAGVMEASKLAGIPYVCHLRDLVQEDHLLSFINEQKQYELLRNADAAIAISKVVHQKFSAAAPNQNFLTSYNGMNVTNYLYEQHSVLNRDHIMIMIVGRIAPGKGQLEAVQAARILRERGISDFTLKIVGDASDADYFRQIKEYVEVNSISQVDFVPFTNSTSELRALREESDINLVCSRAEAMGRVTIESQLAGCLTIGANAGATPELIQNGQTGLLYESGSPEDLADKIEYAVSHTKEMREIAKKGQQYAKETYDSHQYGEKMLELYREILKNRSYINV